MKYRSNWRGGFLLSLIFGLAFSAVSLARPECEFSLNPNLLEALHEAVTDDYRVELFQKQVDGKTKLLVLMGETHVKSATSAEIGRNVVNQFDHIGIEGYDSSKTWGGKFSAHVIDPIIRKFGVRKLPQFWLYRQLGRLYGEGGRTEGSTIFEAVSNQMRARLESGLFQEATPDEVKGLIEALETIPEDRRENSITVEGVKLFSARELLAMARSRLNDSQITTGRVKSKETIHLEKDHVPDFAENWYSVDSYISWGLIAAYYATSSFIPNHYMIPATVAVNAYPFYSLAGTLLERTRFKAKKWYERVFPLGLAILTGRNATMVRNIAETLESRPDVTELLAIVGKAHVQGMKQLLLNAGYTSIPIPTVDQMAAQDALDAAAP